LREGVGEQVDLPSSPDTEIFLWRCLTGVCKEKCKVAIAH
jgi:hypothetical protein